MIHAITVLVSGLYSFYSVILCERSVLKISAFDFTVVALPVRLRGSCCPRGVAMRRA